MKCVACGACDACVDLRTRVTNTDQAIDDVEKEACMRARNA